MLVEMRIDGVLAHAGRVGIHPIDMDRYFNRPGPWASALMKHGIAFEGDNSWEAMSNLWHNPRVEFAILQ